MKLEQTASNTSDFEQEKQLEALASKMKEVYFAYLQNIQDAQKKHSMHMHAILKNIDNKKIKDLKERLKDL